jgi:catechol 2,3-dioxygenase-like lactoylglutathione lyase family enzyme
MAIDLYVGIPITDFAAALAWYERLLGAPPTFVASDTEAVWDLAEHRSLYIALRPEHAGHAMLSLFVDDLDARVAQIAGRGLEPATRETYGDGVRKWTYRDPDGNEIGFGSAPLGG